MHNSFSQEIRLFFSDVWKCWFCGKNTCDSLHHIVGRGAGDSICETSILNAAPICNQNCHLINHGKMRTKEGSKELLNKTLEFVLSNGYVLKQIDYDFLEKYKDWY